MSDRDMLLYFFINNKLKEENTIEFFCQSVDENNPIFKGKNIKKSQDVIRIDLRLAYLRFVYNSDNKTILTEGYINIDAKLKELHETFMELIVKQFIFKFFESLEKTKLENKIPKSNNVHSKEFYEYYMDEINRMTYGDDYQLILTNR